MKKATVKRLEVHRETLIELDARLGRQVLAGDVLTTNCKKSCLSTETGW